MPMASSLFLRLPDYSYVFLSLSDGFQTISMAAEIVPIACRLFLLPPIGLPIGVLEDCSMIAQSG